MSNSSLSVEGEKSKDDGLGSEVREAVVHTGDGEVFGEEIVPGSGREKDGQPPQQFISVANDNMEEALRMWNETKAWRLEHKIDQVCFEAHPDFEVIKKCYPLYIHRKAKNGCYVYFECPGKADLTTLFKREVSLDDMARHYAFITEFLWGHIDRREDARVISVFDLKGTRVTDLAGKTLQLVRKCMGFVQAHYPDRTEKFFLVNAPWWFQTAWSTLSPFVNAKTKERVFVLGSDFQKTLCETAGAEFLPKDYGGTDTTSLGESAAEVYLKKLILSNRKRLGVQGNPA